MRPRLSPSSRYQIADSRNYPVSINVQSHRSGVIFQKNKVRPIFLNTAFPFACMRFVEKFTCLAVRSPTAGVVSGSHHRVVDRARQQRPTAPSRHGGLSVGPLSLKCGRKGLCRRERGGQNEPYYQEPVYFSLVKNDTRREKIKSKVARGCVKGGAAAATTRDSYFRFEQAKPGAKAQRNNKRVSPPVARRLQRPLGPWTGAGTVLNLSSGFDSRFRYR
ncbi:hypothetical protein EVAR_97676_1 [Eumeta japonica]|uniref:Uncharacterized protein n=1 Tax=Eumeta variegata TaxID=151549 RepID=A0A4C1WYH4_EUMVA|nr:hypothetical protein EVAR_97676_1 [Eumeta japonica]